MTQTGLMEQSAAANEALRFFVPGIPVSQGSKIAVAHREKNSTGQWYYTGRAFLVESGNRERKTRLYDWRNLVKTHAQAAIREHQWQTLDEPLTLRLTFLMPSPKSRRFDTPAVQPDLSKLIRAVEDSLEDAGVYANDSRIIQLVAGKRYDEEPGVFITVAKGGE